MLYQSVTEKEEKVEMKIDEVGKVEENEEGKEVMDVVRAHVLELILTTKLVCIPHCLT